MPTSGIEDSVIVLEDAIGEPVGAQVLPDVFDGVQLRRSGWQQDYGQVLWHVEFGGCMPACPVHEDDGMGLAGDVFADLVEMQLHRFGVGPRQHESGAGAPLGTDGAEQVGILVSLVGRQTGACALLCPDAGSAVLLTKPCLILEPYFDRRALRQIGYVCRKRVGEVFLNASITRAS